MWHLYKHWLLVIPSLVVLLWLLNVGLGLSLISCQSFSNFRHRPGISDNGSLSWPYNKKGNSPVDVCVHTRTSLYCRYKWQGMWADLHRKFRSYLSCATSFRLAAPQAPKCRSAGVSHILSPLLASITLVTSQSFIRSLWLSNLIHSISNMLRGPRTPELRFPETSTNAWSIQPSGCWCATATTDHQY